MGAVPSASRGVWMLVDGPIDGDKRVGCAIAEFSPTRVIDITDGPEQFDLATWLRAGRLAVWGLFYGSRCSSRIASLLRGFPAQGVFSGLGAAASWLCRAQRMADRLISDPAFSSVGTIVAHDLYAAVAAVAAAPPSCQIIYDSHEVQFHRNRKTGWLRVLVEVGLEGRVLARADAVRTVSHAIRRLMCNVHATVPPFSVRYNDFYRRRRSAVPPVSAGTAIVYVGRGFRGRLLDVLDATPAELGGEVHVFTLGARLPPGVSGRAWQFGPEDYETALWSLVERRRSIMWCCHAPCCLSYVEALPNKFFQALAVGIPVVAERGTRLAVVVEEHGLGIVRDGRGPAEIHALVATSAYECWCAGVKRFETALREGAVEM